MQFIASHTGSLLNYSIHEVMPRVYAVEVTDDYERGMLFLRAQEYYESTFLEFRGRAFDIFEYMNRYRKHWNKKTFTYPADWAGYNIPSESLESCLRELDEVHHTTSYDDHMANIHWYIRKHLPCGKFYLIGIDSMSSSTMEHEFAHALFYTNPEYRKAMTDLISQMPAKIQEALKDRLMKDGYPEKVLVDEMHAYLSTGLLDKMSKIRGIKTWAKKFSKIFKLYYAKNKNNNGAHRKAAKAIRQVVLSH